MEVIALSRAHAEQISRWRYPDRYATYDVNQVVTPAGGFWAVAHEDALVGYCCFGAPARVPGIDEQEGTLDVGYGMRPDLMGQGLGREFVGAILTFAGLWFDARLWRLLVLDWNERSQAVATALGFGLERTVSSDHDEFLVLVRDALR